MVKKVDPFYVSPQWKAIRLKALRRDDYRCQECDAHCLGKKRNKPTPHVDHIIPRKESPKLALVLSNLRTLCASCHSKRSAMARTDWDKPAIGLDGYPVEQ